MSSIAMVSPTRASTSSRARPMFSGPNAISSRTVGENTCASEFWNTNPTRERNPRENCSSSRLSSVTSVPNTSYRPTSGYSRPSSSFNSVDLPEPFAPSIANFSPCSTVSDTSSSAGKRSRYVYDTSRTSMTDDTIHPQRRARGYKTSDGKQRVVGTDPESRHGPGFAVVATRDHRHVHFLGERVRLPEQRARRRSHEDPRARDVVVARHCARPARGVHVGDRSQQVEEIPVSHSEHEDEHAR